MDGLKQQHWRDTDGAEMLLIIDAGVTYSRSQKPNKYQSGPNSCLFSLGNIHLSIFTWKISEHKK